MARADRRRRDGGPPRAVLATLAVALPLLAAPDAHAQPRPIERTEPDWRNPASWQRLRVGMTQHDVLRILGEPGKVTRYYAFERWEYPDALGRRVNFDERGRLLVWGARAR